MNKCICVGDRHRHSLLKRIAGPNIWSSYISVNCCHCALWHNHNHRALRLMSSGLSQPSAVNCRVTKQLRAWGHVWWLSRKVEMASSGTPWVNPLYSVWLILCQASGAPSHGKGRGRRTANKYKNTFQAWVCIVFDNIPLAKVGHQDKTRECLWSYVARGTDTGRLKSRGHSCPESAAPVKPWPWCRRAAHPLSL